MKHRNILAAVAFVLLAFSATAAAAAKPAAPNPQKLIADSLKAVSGLKDYVHKFDYSELDAKSGKMKSRTCQLWWMTPDYLMLKVLEGENSNSTVAYNPSKNTKKVAAKKNGIPLPGGIAKDSSLITGFFGSDWAPNVKDLKSAAASGKTTIAGSDKVSGRDAWKIQILPKGGDYDKTFFWVDKKNSYPLKVEHYKKGKLFSVKTWYDIKVNAGLTPDDFKP